MHVLPPITILLTVVQPPPVAPSLVRVQVDPPCLGCCGADEPDASGELAQLVVRPAAIRYDVHTAESEEDVRGVRCEELLTGLTGEGAEGG